MRVDAASNRLAADDFNALTICHGLGRQAASHIASIGRRVTYGAAQTIFSEGDKADSVFEVVRGMLKLYKLLPDGRRQITGFLCAGHLIGLADQDLYLYTAEAVTEVTLCRYPRGRLDRLVDEVPGFARVLLAATSDELRAAQDQMLLLGRKDATEKIASFLLMMADRQDAEGPAREIQVPMGRNDIADYLGLTIETVSRMLAKLKSRGLIALQSPARIDLQDRGRLVDLAAGEGEENE